VLRDAGKPAEAETLFRQALAIRADSRLFYARSLLGGSLLGQKKYAQAESLLLAGYEGMKQREAKMPANGKIRLKEAG